MSVGMAGPHYPSAIAAQAAAVASGMPSEADVGAILRRLDASRVLSGDELEQHIRDCETLWKRAYARFREHHIPADRDEALLWLHRQNEAILMRSPAVKDAREAEIWADIFMEQGERDRRRLAQVGRAPGA